MRLIQESFERVIQLAFWRVFGALKGIREIWDHWSYQLFRNIAGQMYSNDAPDESFLWLMRYDI